MKLSKVNHNIVCIRQNIAFVESKRGRGKNLSFLVCRKGMNTMKRKGFTLIELLGVIVVLAVIALITTPVILGVIEKARKGASEQSALGYVDAVEKQVALNSLDLEKEDIKDGVYTVSKLRELGVSIKGQSPSDESWVKIKDG